MKTTPQKQPVSTPPTWLKTFLAVVIALAVILALAALVIMFNWAQITRGLSQEGWGAFAAVIQRNKISALWHASLMSAALALGIWLLCCTPGLRRAVAQSLAWLLVLLVAADAFYLARHYIKTMPLSAVAENDVIRILKSAQPDGRAALVSQSGFYNLWLTYLLPYHHIQVMNVTQMPRMPQDYKQFLEALGGQPLRLWQLSAVTHVLGPAQFWNHLQQDEQLRAAFRLLYAYNVIQDDARVTVIPASAEQPGQHVVLELKLPAPRFALLAGWEALPDDEVLHRLADEAFPLWTQVLVAPECAQDLAPLAGRGLRGRIQRKSGSAREVILDIITEEAAILRIANKYDPDWKAWVDGQPQPVLRVDYIFQGVYIAPGRHEVFLRYAPRIWTAWLQGPAIFLALCAGAWLLIIRKRKTG